MTFTDADILSFIQNSPEPVTKRQISQAFKVKGGENRVAIKQILKTLKNDGVITKHPGGAYSAPEGLPNVGVVEIYEVSVDGDVLARPQDWNGELQGKAPIVFIQPDKKYDGKLAEGVKALVRFSRSGEHEYQGHVIKVIEHDAGRVLGLVQYNKHGPILVPTDKKAKYDFAINPGDLNGAKEGDLAVGEIQSARGIKRKRVEITEVIGRQGDPRAISIISLHEAGLSEEWPDAVLKETNGMKVPDVKGREDLRDIPLVTIDGADARDFDDAVFAEATDDGGYHIIVAIADVAYYVRHGSALDDEAMRRGNSTYFPDRVVPMLPEALSNDLCSLRPNENRACMAVHMYIDAHGKLVKYKFVRGLMRSAARLIYEQVQAARDGVTDDLTGPLMDKVINPLYAAFEILDKARKKRGALDLDLPEKQILIDKNGNMTGVKVRERLDAHKLIEELMILANVAAASALEDKNDPKRYPCVYRIHDQPSTDKLESVREFLESFDLSLPKGSVSEPKQLNSILTKAAELPYSHLISTVILRSQSQAIYHAQNIGHFGLALNKYAHFTSPIRRYADLLVHRSLISAYGLGPGGISEEEVVTIDEICDHISTTERNSMVAERSAVDRFTAAYLSQKVGAEFEGRISGVTKFGLFVTLNESGADGIVPMRSINNDFYVHEEDQHALIGRRHGRVFRLGATVTVRLTEADGLTGSTVLELAGNSLEGADIPGVRFKSKGRQIRDGGKKKPFGKSKRTERSRSGKPKDKHSGKKGNKFNGPKGKKGGQGHSGGPTGGKPNSPNSKKKKR